MTEGRFGGIARLVGDDALARLRQAHVCVVGLGGVGGWTVEALARSGVGALTLIDADDVCETNINRQVHALESTVGRSKAAALAERLAAIHPGCSVTPVETFFHRTNARELLAPGFDLVVDGVDRVMAKVCLIGHARARNIPVITCGGAGGRLDPFAITVADLADTNDDPLLAYVRKKLRRIYQFPPPGTRFGVPCVFSREPLRQPAGCSPDQPRSCETGLGAITHVTGTFGFLLAGLAIDQLTGRTGGAWPP